MNSLLGTSWSCMLCGMKGVGSARWYAMVAA
jgi:hypothetical protein